MELRRCKHSTLNRGVPGEQEGMLIRRKKKTHKTTTLLVLIFESTNCLAAMECSGAPAGSVSPYLSALGSGGVCTWRKQATDMLFSASPYPKTTT